VELVLPAAPDIEGGGLGVVVAKPVVELVLPAPPDVEGEALGMVVANPVVGLVLPVSGGGSLGVAGTIVATPTVILEFGPSSPGGVGPSDVAGGGSGSSGGEGVGTTFQLRLVEVTAPSGSGRRAGPATEGWEVVLEWNGPAASRYVVESSSDLLNWRAETSTAEATAGQSFRVRCVAPSPEAHFYRVRILP
jgi:hypothetical protein